MRVSFGTRLPPIAIARRCLARANGARQCSSPCCGSRWQPRPRARGGYPAHVIDMTDGTAVRHLTATGQFHLVVPETKAIGTLPETEGGAWRSHPPAPAAPLTRNRQRIRRLAAEKPKPPSPPCACADDLEPLRPATDAGIGYLGGVKRVVSSSAMGQSRVDGPLRLFSKPMSFVHRRTDVAPPNGCGIGETRDCVRSATGTAGHKMSGGRLLLCCCSRTGAGVSRLVAFQAAVWAGSRCGKGFEKTISAAGVRPCPAAHLMVCRRVLRAPGGRWSRLRRYSPCDPRCNRSRWAHSGNRHRTAW